MTWKRWIITTGLIAAFATTGPILAADENTPAEPKPPQEEPKKAPAPEATPETTKPRFWGDHFALFLEVAGGAGASDHIESSIQTSAGAWAISKTKLDDVTIGRIGIGWKLPADRGGFLVSFTGYRENKYSFDSVGFKKAVLTAGTAPSVAEGYRWWTLDVNDGNLTSELLPPVWVDVARLEPHCPVDSGPPPLPPPGICVNGVIDAGEVTLSTSPTLTFRTRVPDNAQNRLQLVDGLYQREFGGHVWSGEWSAGLRYMIYQGNVPATAWLNAAPSAASLGFTDGAGLHLIVVNQDTSGLGPTGTLGFQYHTWRRRLTLYARATFAFLLESLNSDTGDFITLVRNTSGNNSNELVAPARLQRSVTKSSWNFGAELGTRVRIADGFSVEAGWNKTAYQDTVLLPFSITIPATAGQISGGTVGLFTTHDVTFDVFHVGLTFQF